MKFYNGAVTYSGLNKMTIPEIIKLNDLACRISRERAEQEKAAMRKK